LRFFIGLFSFVVLLGLGISFPLIQENSSSSTDGAANTRPVDASAISGSGSPGRGVASTGASAGGQGSASGPQLSGIPKSPLTQRVQSIHSALLCWSSNDCNYPETDPRSYSFAVAKDIANQLDEFLKESDDPKFAEEAEKIAEESMKILDGHVQSKALEIYGKLPPSGKNLQSILSGIENSPNPLVVEQSMKEFQRYLGTPEEEKIQAFLSNFIAHGGQFSSEQASEAIYPFLNERSVGQFRDALTKMESASTQAQYLRAAIQEFERSQSGG